MKFPRSFGLRHPDLAERFLVGLLSEVLWPSPPPAGAIQLPIGLLVIVHVRGITDPVAQGCDAQHGVRIIGVLRVTLAFGKGIYIYIYIWNEQDPRNVQIRTNQYIVPD